MSSKANPGTFDCIGKLADDEPFFVLRAQDQTSAGFRARMGGSCGEARLCS